jgi:endonuclease/exonuclease/phosphatase family metal-dependent hydrolase
MLLMPRSSLVLLLLLTGVDANVEPRLTLRVLTYNIHHGEGTDRRLDLERIGRVIERLRPDLVALQEVDVGTERADGVNQVAELTRLTGMHAQFGKAMDYEGGAYGVAVLSRWPFEETRTSRLRGSPDREPRAALTVRLRPGARAPIVQFTSTHLDQGREQENRLAQASSLNELLAGNPDLPAILAGDMNARPDTEVMQILEAEWSNASVADPQPLLPDGRPRRRGDHVLFRPAGAWRVVEWTSIDETLASDHRPILAVLEWMGQN